MHKKECMNLSIEVHTNIETFGNKFGCLQSQQIKTKPMNEKSRQRNA